MKNLLRKPLLSFKPYVTGKPIEEVRREYGLKGRIAKLASNENPLGTSPKALEAMRKALDSVCFYPDDHAFNFRKRVAELYGVDPQNIFPACGSVEILETTGTAFLTAGDSIVTSEKTFAVYALVAAKAGAEAREAPMIDGGFRYDLNAMAKLIDHTTKIVYLANPTNPTGTWFTKTEFDEFMTKVPEDVLVVYDTAYEEYCTEPDLPDPLFHLNQGRRILILRTFSKAYGLAGIRMGYAVGPTDIIQGLMICRLPFNTNVLGQVAAIAALDDHDFVKRTRDHNTAEMAFLRRGMEGLPVTIPPSQTNFILIDTPKDAYWLFTELQKKGVIVRPMGAYHFPCGIRVSTGLREDNEAFLNYFKILLQSGEGYPQNTGC